MFRMNSNVACAKCLNNRRIFIQKALRDLRYTHILQFVFMSNVYDVRQWVDYYFCEQSLNEQMYVAPFQPTSVNEDSYATNDVIR